MQQPFNRREFAKALVLGAATVPVAQPSRSAAAGDRPQQKPVQAERPEASKQEKPEASEADLVLAVVKHHYPDERLDEKVLDAIRGDIQGDLARSRVLSSFPLKNSDEPAFVFAAYRADDSR